MNKGDVELTLSKNNNSLKTDKYMTAIDAHYIGIAVLYLLVFRLLLTTHASEQGVM